MHDKSLTASARASYGSSIYLLSLCVAHKPGALLCHIYKSTATAIDFLICSSWAMRRGRVLSLYSVMICRLATVIREAGSVYRVTWARIQPSCIVPCEETRCHRSPTAFMFHIWRARDDPHVELYLIHFLPCLRFENVETGTTGIGSRAQKTVLLYTYAWSHVLRSSHW